MRNRISRPPGNGTDAGEEGSRASDAADRRTPYNYPEFDFSTDGPNVRRNVDAGDGSLRDLLASIPGWCATDCADGGDRREHLAVLYTRTRFM